MGRKRCRRLEPWLVEKVMAMAAVGLVSFARVALEVARAVVPAYRSKFSKHLYTQPQMLALLSLMRYEDWTLREGEVRLREHSELREALGLKGIPDHTTIHRFLRRLRKRTIDQVLEEVVRRLPPPPREVLP